MEKEIDFAVHQIMNFLISQIKIIKNQPSAPGTLLRDGSCMAGALSPFRASPSHL
jgi:hypothetical protein